MGDHQQNSFYDHHTLEAEDQPGRGQDDVSLGLQGTVYENVESKDPKFQDLDDGDLKLEDQEEEIPPEEVAEEESVDAQNPEEALLELERVLEKDMEEGMPEMRRLSISQRAPHTSVSPERKKRRRLFELAKPKTNWQVLKDRMGCCCRGHAWVSPRMRSLQFCIYWPSVYWTERFLEDTTLTITVPEVSRRVEELARPKRFYSKYYNNRTTSIWPIPRSTLEYRASNRLRELATPKVRNNIWSINMSEGIFLTQGSKPGLLHCRQILLPPEPPALERGVLTPGPPGKSWTMWFNMHRRACPWVFLCVCLTDQPSPPPPDLKTFTTEFRLYMVWMV
ncbi:sperm microtubule associated protein 2 isoform X3 [Odocoileus virginianus]|uniref:Sperm microtubule associated protein 2 isoform X3 n=1 Tax=Odocoileus virginianus TaxID=9874 RepID=A0ABM4I0J6_ODOVR